jgi:hypothetical protein
MYMEVTTCREVEYSPFLILGSYGNIKLFKLWFTALMWRTMRWRVAIA